jgi:hypothetical protein
MSRIVPAALVTALGNAQIEPFFAIEMMFDTRTITFNGESIDVGPLRLWSGMYDKTINVQGSDQTFTGTGGLLSIGGLEEAGDLSAKSVTLTLSGIPSTIISLALQEPYQRRACRIYFGVEGVSDVVEIFTGKMNTMRILDSEQTATIEMTVESKLVELERSSNLRYTDLNHKSRKPNDAFFEYVQSIQDVKVAWGRKAG